MTKLTTVVSQSGDSALRVACEWNESSGREAAWRLVHHLARRLDAWEWPGVQGTIPTYDAVLVEFDPVVADPGALRCSIERLIVDIDPDEPLTRSPQHFDVPVLYDADETPDLLAVAEYQGLLVDDIVQLHSAPTYTVRCLGAPGGSPMLDGPDFPRPVPRLASPRARVPQGVVSVAGRQATITPAEAPGGWHLVGRTPLVLMDLSAEPFVPYSPGDTLRFYPIDRAEFMARKGEKLVAQ